MGKNKPITISLPEEQLARVRSYCDREGRTLSGTVRRALDQLLEQEQQQPTGDDQNFWK